VTGGPRPGAAAAAGEVSLDPTTMTKALSVLSMLPLASDQ